MARFKKGDTAIHVQYIRGRVNPALIATRHGESEVVAFFKDMFLIPLRIFEFLVSMRF